MPKPKKETIAQKKERIQKLIDKASALELELVWIPKIMSRQTYEEVKVGQTIEYNKIGLSGYDGRFISDIERHIKYGSHLNEKQASAVRRVLRKYWKQYSEMMKPTVINGKF